jgi:hypothetical protein
MAITIDVVDEKTGRIESKPLDILANQSSLLLTLECLKGASALQIVLRKDQTIVFCAEIEVRRARTCEATLSALGGDRFRVECGRRPVFTLAVADPSLRTLAQVMTARQSESIDLLFLIDGTMRYVGRPSAASSQTEAVSYSFLLEPHNRDQWRAFVDQLTALAAELAKRHRGSRFGVLAFGDDPIPGISNPELKAQYRLKPDPDEGGLGPKFWSDHPDQLQRQLSVLRHTPGGDFVDALAEGFRACRSVDWRHETRKIVFVFGDSPGYSVLHPLAPARLDTKSRADTKPIVDMRLGNYLVRKVDTDAEADALFEAGVEVFTLYKEETESIYQTDAAAPFLDYARNQYQRLATCSEYAATSDKFDALAAASAIIENSSTIFGRGACPGFLRSLKKLV